MSNLRPGQGADAFSVRFPDGMRERIKAAADRNGRSMNAEIVATLAEHYPPPRADVSSLDGLIHYLISGDGQDEQRRRLAEVNARLHSMGSPFRMKETAPHNYLIVTEDDL
jgi:hypothetical protein